MKEYILMSWKLINDARNPNNIFGIQLMTEELFRRIEDDEINSLEDYISFKNEWYPQVKNREF